MRERAVWKVGEMISLIIGATTLYGLAYPKDGEFLLPQWGWILILGTWAAAHYVMRYVRDSNMDVNYKRDVETARNEGRAESESRISESISRIAASEKRIGELTEENRNLVAQVQRLEIKSSTDLEAQRVALAGANERQVGNLSEKLAEVSRELEKLRTESEKQLLHIDKTWVKHHDETLSKISIAFGQHVTAPFWRKWPRMTLIDRTSDAWKSHEA